MVAFVIMVLAVIVVWGWKLATAQLRTGTIFGIVVAGLVGAVGIAVAIMATLRDLVLLAWAGGAESLSNGAAGRAGSLCGLTSFTRATAYSGSTGEKSLDLG